MLLATDRPSLGAALSLFLSGKGIEVVAVVAHAQDVLASAEATRADIVLIDWHLGAAATAEVVGDLKDGPRETPVIILGSSENSASAHVSGADGFATVGDAPDDLLAVMRDVVSTAN